MAAAKPLPLTEQRRAFLINLFPTPDSSRSQSGASLFSSFPDTAKQKKEESNYPPPKHKKDKRKVQTRGEAWSVLLLVLTQPCPLLLPLDPQRNFLQILLSQVRPPRHEDSARHLPHLGALQELQNRWRCSRIPEKAANRRGTPPTVPLDPPLQPSDLWLPPPTLDKEVEPCLSFTASAPPVSVVWGLAGSQ